MNLLSRFRQRITSPPSGGISEDLGERIFEAYLRYGEAVCAQQVADLSPPQRAALSDAVNKYILNAATSLAVAHKEIFDAGVGQ